MLCLLLRSWSLERSWSQFDHVHSVLGGFIKDVVAFQES